MNIDSYALIWLGLGITTYAIGCVEDLIRGNKVFPEPILTEVHIMAIVIILGGMSAYQYIMSWFIEVEDDWYE